MGRPSHSREPRGSSRDATDTIVRDGMVAMVFCLISDGRGEVGSGRGRKGEVLEDVDWMRQAKKQAAAGAHQQHEPNFARAVLCLQCIHIGPAAIHYATLHYQTHPPISMYLTSGVHHVESIYTYFYLQ